MIEELLKYDTQLFQFFNGLGSARWDGFWRAVTLKWSSIPLYVVLLVFIYRHFGWKGTLVILICTALAITTTDQLANFFKHHFERPRPCRVPALQATIRFVAARCGAYGYFSAHAANSMAVAVFVGASLRPKHPWLVYALVFWAVAVAYSRVYLGVHYPLDILTGMLIGSIFGWGFYKLQLLIRSKYGL